MRPEQEEPLQQMTEYPELVLPDPIKVKPPRYTYEKYEQEKRDWKGADMEWQLEQRRRWREGHAKLTGIHYFYLTQIKIKHKGQLIRPLWRDVDEMVIEDYLDCLHNEIDQYVFKRRGIGLSTIYGGLIPIYIFVTNPGSTCLMTSADLGRVNDLKNEKFISQLSSLEDWIGVKLKKNDTQNQIIEIKHYDEFGHEMKGVISQMLCRQTSQDKKDVGKFEGARAAYAFLDELFLHPYPNEVRSQTESCLMDDFSRWGIMVSGGSAGLGNRLGMEEGRRIWEDSAGGSFNKKSIFIPGTLGVSAVTIKSPQGKKIGEENFCINGWSDEARAHAFITWQRNILEAENKKKDLISFVKRYPMEIDDVFESEIIGAIPKDIAEMIPIRLKEIRDGMPNIRRMSIRYEGSEPKLVEDKNGPFHMLRKPKRGKLYIMGTDPIPMVETANETTEINEANGSMFCSVIKDPDDQEYVGIYLKRAWAIEKIYRDITGLQKLYNEAKNMVERNRAEALHTHYRLDSNLDGLAKQPQWMGKSGYKKSNTRGWWKNGSDDRPYEATFDYFRNYMDDVWFSEMLEQLQIFGLPKTNCDIVDAVISCEVYHKDLAITDGQRAIMAQQAKYKEVPYTVIENGVRRIKYKKLLANGKEIGADRIDFGMGHKLR